MANANDTFTEASDTSLVSHTSDSGHTWSKHVGNVLTVLASGDYLYNASPTNISRYKCSVTPASAEYDVQADVISTINWCCGVSGRIVTADQDEYYCEYENSLWKLRKLDAGAVTTFATYSGDSPNGTTRTVKLEIRDATKKVFVDGVERISSTDNSLTAAGNPGIYWDGNSSGTQMDNWSSTDYAGGGSADTAVDTDGAATATGVGSSVATSNVSSAGAGTATAVSAATASANLSSSGVSTAEAEASTIADGSADVSSAGASTATAVGQATASSDVTSAGTGTSTAEGAAVTEGAATAYATGTSSAEAVGSALASSDVQADGESTATATTEEPATGHSTSRRHRMKMMRRKRARLHEENRAARDDRDIAIIMAAVRDYYRAAYRNGFSVD